MSFLFKPKRWLAPMDYINLLYGINMQIVVEFHEFESFVDDCIEDAENCADIDDDFGHVGVEIATETVELTNGLIRTRHF